MRLTKFLPRILICTLFLFAPLLLCAQVNITIVEPVSELLYGEVLDLSIRISGLSQALGGFEMNFNYDPNYLELVSSTEGSLLSDVGPTQWYSIGSPGTQILTCAVLSHNPGSMAEGTLFTVSLRALNQSTGSTGTQITLSDLVLREPENHVITYETPGTANVVISPQSFLIPLQTGWNLVSSPVFPEDPDMMVVFDQLISDGFLVKVQDEVSHSLVFDSGAGWLNSIGNWSVTEGYYVQVNADCILEIVGNSIDLPLTIPLNSGWNIIPYPYLSSQPAMDVLTPLISAGSLVKAQDEYSVSIVYDNGWIDNIGMFETSEGYHIRVNTDTEIVYPSINKSKLSVATEANDSVLKLGK